MASELAKARLLGDLAGKPADVLLRIHTGLDLGVPVTVALREIYTVEGRAFLSSRLIQGLVRRSGAAKYLRCTEKTGKRATWTTARTDDPEHECARTWTIESAYYRGIAKSANGKTKANWARYPDAMLSARALSDLCRDVYGDVLLGAEVWCEDDEEGGEVAEAEVIDESPAASAGADAPRAVAPRVGDAPGGIHWHDWTKTPDGHWHGEYAATDGDGVVVCDGTGELVEPADKRIAGAVAWAWAA